MFDCLSLLDNSPDYAAIILIKSLNQKTRVESKQQSSDEKELASEFAREFSGDENLCFRSHPISKIIIDIRK